MKRSGQVTVFIILGIIIVAVVAFVLYARNAGLSLSPVDLFGRQELSVRDEVRTCIIEVADPSLDILGRQGGSYSPNKFKLYQGNEVNYLCYNREDTDVCTNRILRLQDLETEIEEYTGDRIKSCIDARFSALRQEAAITTKAFSIDVTIARDNVLILVNYPTTITFEDTTTNIDSYLQIIDKPLGKLYGAVDIILTGESLIGDFDPLPYMIVHKDVEIRKDRPYPDKVYILNEVNDDYIFQFAIEGESK